mgnify:CR=1 FL=1
MKLARFFLREVKRVEDIGNFSSSVRILSTSTIFGVCGRKKEKGEKKDEEEEEEEGFSSCEACSPVYFLERSNFFYRSRHVCARVCVNARVSLADPI